MPGFSLQEKNEEDRYVFFIDGQEKERAILPSTRNWILSLVEPQANLGKQQCTVPGRKTWTRTHRTSAPVETNSGLLKRSCGHGLGCPVTH
ncbi:hypothetical protein AGOR_G00073590 [Albula goreensis]|uniref:Uncharacterized protein n=1 Tax=Albula goreensis TaxID=1534307 RepID=A0A8T3DV46_9TELE|nr:hypothetical protein AGOR_G00073590 [Albula goreensis]